MPVWLRGSCQSKHSKKNLKPNTWDIVSRIVTYQPDGTELQTQWHYRCSVTIAWDKVISVREGHFGTRPRWLMSMNHSCAEADLSFLTMNKQWTSPYVTAPRQKPQSSTVPASATPSASAAPPAFAALSAFVLLWVFRFIPGRPAPWQSLHYPPLSWE